MDFDAGAFFVGDFFVVSVALDEERDSLTELKWDLDNSARASLAAAMLKASSSFSFLS